MTALQIIAVLMTPVAGLLICAVMVYIVSKDTARADHRPAE